MWKNFATTLGDFKANMLHSLVFSCLALDDQMRVFISQGPLFMLIF